VIISENSVLIGLDAKTKDEIIHKLSALAFQNGSITDEEEFLKSVFEREGISSSYCGNNIAIPHGKSKSVVLPFVMFAKLKNTINWDEEGESTDLVFMIGIPEENKDNIHLRIISFLCRKLVDDKAISFLMNKDLTAAQAFDFVNIKEEDLYE